MRGFVIVLAALLQIALAGPIHPGPVKNTPENIARINAADDRTKVEELSGQFEGDIILTEPQEKLIFGGERNGLIDTRYRWPDNIVPYVITDDFNANQRAQIEQGLRTIESVTCIRFVERTDEVDYVEVIGENSGCWSYVGRIGNMQQLNLQLNGCVLQRTIMHEFLHALGFYHMQSSYERENYVRVAWEHIQEGLESNFNMYGPDRVTNFGNIYDIRSIMHYSAYSFTKNGFATIIPNDITEINRIGYYPDLSDIDIAKINAMYNCPA